MLDLTDRLDRRNVCDGLACEPPADGIDRITRDLQRRSPGRFERGSSSRLRDDRIEAGDGGLAVRVAAGDPDDEASISIEPWIENGDPRELVEAAERRQRH